MSPYLFLPAWLFLYFHKRISPPHLWVAWYRRSSPPTTWAWMKRKARVYGLHLKASPDCCWGMSPRRIWAPAGTRFSCQSSTSTLFCLMSSSSALMRLHLNEPFRVWEHKSATQETKDPPQKVSVSVFKRQKTNKQTSSLHLSQCYNL